MTDTWAIAIIGFALTIMTAILCWMATALWGIKKSLREFVTDDECKSRMGSHCNEINKLRKIAEENQKASHFTAVSVTDFLYKIENGYHSFSHGKGRHSDESSAHGVYPFAKDMWKAMLS